MENKKNLFQVPASIQGISTLKDRTMKLTAYVSREIPGEEMAKLFELEGSEGWLMFSPNPFQPKDIPEEPAKVEGNRKSSSERLYNVMFVYWQQNNKGGDFNQWKATQMERIIENYKNQLI